MRDRPGNIRMWAVGAIGVLAVVAGVIVVMARKKEPVGPSQPATPAEVLALPLMTETPHLNARQDVKFVGTEACKECHAENHKSYLHTAHSRALADLDPAVEPADGTFEHKASGRTYRVYRQGNQFRHEEILRTSEGKEIARMDVPIRYLIGSGNFCRSYLVELDGFLHESPITWYASRKTWDMSPGYDFAAHWSFERAVSHRCLSCHAGRVEQVERSVHRHRIFEQAIGCESCHGPGSAHLEFHRAGRKIEGDEDLTIVNPGKLSRNRLEGLCAVCHMNSAAKVPLRGRDPSLFRPGQLLTDYQIEFRYASGNDQMTVVGHIEQLRASRCYEKSESMTCLTCHEPHAKEPPKNVVAHFRQKCLNCHKVDVCKAEHAAREKASDNCATCHMPRGDTDIPHVAFTHHRVGKHLPKAPTKAPLLADLVPVEEVNLPALDQKRNLGLAYLHVAAEAKGRAQADAYRDRARDLLEETVKAGMRDAMIDEALARIYWEMKDVERATAAAQRALASKDLPADNRSLALIVLATCRMQDRRFADAIPLLQELTRMRRYAEDWRLLGACYMEMNQPKEALPALEQALAIRPFRADIHGALSDVYGRLGFTQRAKDHLEKARWLEQHHQQ